MGVPVFFKWLCMRNPKILRDALLPPEGSFTSGNPQVDNFYIDMNGLIHPACNPKGQNIRQPANFAQQCQNIYEYVDMLINIVRPRRILYLAIDGVAPRAKMNQQRSRRFRAAMQSGEINKKKEQLLQHYRQMDASTQELQQYVNKKSFDSNLITPGTQFLSAVSAKIRQYILDRLHKHPHWKNLLVFFSDANVPGEGEHKIMHFIRQQRASTHYDPNQSHCIYGADADLIMLGLATHQPRFWIIREVVVTANQKYCTNCGKKGHYFMDCRAADSIQNQAVIQQQQNQANINIQFQFLNLKLIREHLHLHFSAFPIAFAYDLQRVIDDFIFLCFFVGNDFLPHIPCLSIREGGIDVLMRVYGYCLSLLDGYITEAGQVVMSRLSKFIKEMASYQRQLISEMINKEAYEKRRDALKQANSSINSSKENSIDYRAPVASFKQQIKRLTNADLSLENYSVFSHSIQSYKQKYYREKFRITAAEFLQFRKAISKAYIQALNWICAYYYKGVCSWGWFYPFHYSPFFTDLDVGDENPMFELGAPFKPFQQLMAVLPPKTFAALPAVLHPLMLSNDSPLVDYFPSQFVIDLVGKKFAWLGQVLLPFIDDKRLLAAMGNYQQYLTEEESNLNRLGSVRMYLNRHGQYYRRWGALPIDQRVELRWQRNGIDGVVQILHQQDLAIQMNFQEPEGRVHSIMLKSGIQYSMLQELSEQFIRRTDRKGYGGQRFVRVIQRVLGQKLMHMRNAPILEMPRKSDTKQKERDRDRSRSRDRRRERGGYQKQGYGYGYGYGQGQRDRYRNDRRQNRGRHEDRRQSRDDRRYDDRRGRDYDDRRGRDRDRDRRDDR